METSSYYYNLVAGLATVPSRAKRGMCGILTLEGNWDGHNWLSKRDQEGAPVDPKGRPLIYREWQFLCKLQGTGLVPVVDTESSPLDNGMFYIECINNAATVGDYVSAYLDGLIPIEVVKDILTLTQKSVEEFHSLGFIHNDLHGNNVVVGHDRQGWRVYIIDVALSTFDGHMPQWLDDTFSLCNLAEEDFVYLSEDLSALGEGCSDPTRVDELNLLLSRLF